LAHIQVLTVLTSGIDPDVPQATLPGDGGAMANWYKKQVDVEDESIPITIKYDLLKLCGLHREMIDGEEDPKFTGSSLKLREIFKYDELIASAEKLDEEYTSDLDDYKAATKKSPIKKKRSLARPANVRRPYTRSVAMSPPAKAPPKHASNSDSSSDDSMTLNEDSKMEVPGGDDAGDDVGDDAATPVVPDKPTSPRMYPENYNNEDGSNPDSDDEARTPGPARGRKRKKNTPPKDFKIPYLAHIKNLVTQHRLRQWVESPIGRQTITKEYKVDIWPPYHQEKELEGKNIQFHFTTLSSLIRSYGIRPAELFEFIAQNYDWVSMGSDVSLRLGQLDDEYTANAALHEHSRVDSLHTFFARLRVMKGVGMHPPNSLPGLCEDTCWMRDAIDYDKADKGPNYGPLTVPSIKLDCLTREFKEVVDVANDDPALSGALTSCFVFEIYPSS
jgi:hypothetical protein